MRITVHVPDTLEKEIKATAQNEHASVSSLVAKALRYYLLDTRRQKAGQKILDLAGKTSVSPDALSELEEGREDFDRP